MTGRTLSDWDDRVSLWLHDMAQRDVPTESTIERVGLPAALAQYGRDRGQVPRVIELAGNGTGYYTLPGFDERTDRLASVEYPARRNPPDYLDSSLYGLGRSSTVVDDVRLVLYAHNPTVTQYLRVTWFSSAALPYPTEDPATDLVPADAFVFVAALAASYCCVQLLTEASRDRQAAIPTDFADGTDRATMLQAAADRLANVYRTFMGLPPVAAAGADVSPSRPAWGRFQVSTGRSSLFHRP